MIAFELLTLELPYTEIPKTWLISKAIIEGVPPALPKDLDSSYGDIVALFYSCISFNPTLRPKSAAVLAKLQLLAQISTDK